MSFATGLFSFMGGMSRQYREEIDASDAAKATAATAAVEHDKWILEQKSEKEKFELGKEQFQTTQSFLETKEKTRKLEKRGELLFKRQEFKEKTKQSASEYKLDVEKFNQSNIEWRFEFDEKVLSTRNKENLLVNKFDLDKDIFALDTEKVNNQVQQYADTLGLSKDELELQHDKLEEIVRHNMRTESIDEMEALLDADKGIRTYKGETSDDDIKLKPRVGPDEGTENERLRSAITSYMDLTNEAVEKLSPEGRLDLLQDITDDMIGFKNFNYNKEQNIWVNFLPQLEPILDVDIVQEAMGNVNQSMKNQAKNTYKENGVDADTVLIELGSTMIGSSAISYGQLAKQAGFETAEQLKNSLDELVAHTNIAKIVTGSLSPFSSHERILSTLKAEKIPVSILKLAPSLNYIQELDFKETQSILSPFYVNLIREAEELGIIDENGKGLDKLSSFIYKVMPNGEVGSVLKEGGIQALDDKHLPPIKLDIGGADSQSKAAEIAVQTIDQLINLINQSDAENFGLPMKTAAFIEKARNTFQGMANLITKISSEDDKNPWKNNVDRQKYINKLTELQKKVGGGDTLKSLAATNARLQYLKFSLAYQMSMALQGGSGGRTISDQDVENMLRALQMDGIMQDASQVKASLQTIRSFMVGIRNIADFEKLNTTKGYRARTHLLGLMDAMNIVNEESLANELNDKVYGLEKPENLGGNVNMNFFRAQNGFNIEMSSDGIPVYIKWDGFSPNKKETYIMSQGEFTEFVNRAKEKGEEIGDYTEEDGTVKQIPQYELGKVMHRGVILTKTYSSLLAPQEGI